MAGFDLTCRCGAVHLRVDVPRRGAGTRVVCHCRDCQTAARVLGAEDLLGPGAGTDIWQTTPDLLEVVEGAELLRILRLSPKGLKRWHAGCCETPLMNTLDNVKLPFVGFVLGRPDPARDKVTGPVFGHAFTASAPPGSGGPAKDVNFARTGLGVVTRMITAYLSGRAKDNRVAALPPPKIRVLSLEERRAATPT